MLQALVHFSLKYRGVVVVLACILLGYGLYVASNAKLDVFPNFVQPQVAILDVEAIVRRPTVVVDPSGEERIAIAPMCVLGLSWDHRALDGVLAAQFLGALRKRLESLEEPA